jgi:cytochrome c-type biogenesis protein CcmE
VDPSRKRRIRLVVALSAAVLLAGALVWTSFSAGRAQLLPSEALARADVRDEAFELGGTVKEGSVRREGDRMSFVIKDPNGSAQIPVRYTGTVPDPFREGREVLVDGRLRGSTFVGEPGTMTTKCPSKFTKKQS